MLIRIVVNNSVDLCVRHDSYIVALVFKESMGRTIYTTHEVEMNATSVVTSGMYPYATIAYE